LNPNRLITALLPCAAALLALTGPASALAQPAPARPLTVDVVATGGKLTDKLPDASALDLRLTLEEAGGHVFGIELLRERKFGADGGLLAASYTRVLAPDWVLAGTLTGGHGGPNWPNHRVDVELTTKWLQSKTLLTRVALYRAGYDNDRSDRGGRLSLVGYLPGTVVVEGGAIVNVSQPGRVDSTMPFFSATLGSAGVQYFSARVASGTEAYQALGGGAQLVNFRSRSLGLTWRRWLAPDWGYTLQGEAYHNPTYERLTLGGGLFMQF